MYFVHKWFRTFGCTVFSEIFFQIFIVIGKASSESIVKTGFVGAGAGGAGGAGGAFDSFGHCSSCTSSSESNSIKSISLSLLS